MFTSKNFLLSILTVLVFTGMFFAQSTHKELFERARYTMETKGDLKSAIDQFETIIQDFSEEKEYGARSQYYIGLCYQKMGLIEAQKAFEKVIRNYPGEEEVVTLARNGTAPRGVRTSTRSPVSMLLDRASSTCSSTVGSGLSRTRPGTP